MGLDCHLMGYKHENVGWKSLSFNVFSVSHLETDIWGPSQMWTSNKWSEIPIRIELGPTHLTQECTSQVDLRLGWQVMILFLRHSCPLPSIILLRNIFNGIFQCLWLKKWYNSAPCGNDSESFIFHRNFFWFHNTVPAAEPLQQLSAGFGSHTDVGTSSASPWLVKWPWEMANLSEPVSQL